MKLIPFDHYVLVTELGIEEIKERLGKELDQAREELICRSGDAYTTGEPRMVLNGLILNDGFYLYRKSNSVRNSVIVKVSGKWMATPKGTEINVRIELRKSAFIFLVVWIVLFSLIVVSKIITRRLNQFSFDSLIPFIMFIILFVVIIFMYNEERSYLKNAVSMVINGNKL